MTDNDWDIPNTVRERATRVFTEELFARWLTGSEPFLGGRRPIDVIRAGEVTSVIDALNAIASGGHA